MKKMHISMTMDSTNMLGARGLDQSGGSGLSIDGQTAAYDNKSSDLGFTIHSPRGAGQG